MLDAGGWLPSFPAAVTETLSIDPVSPSSFPGGLKVDAAVGDALPHETVSAARRPGGTWEARVTVIPGLENWIRLLPEGQEEIRPYPAPYGDWIDTRRFFTPPAAPTTYFTREGVYGVAARGKTAVAEPDSRDAMMRAAFGDRAVGAGVFGPRELPHGATTVGSDVFFVVHAPHAAWAALVLVDEGATGRAATPRGPHVPDGRRPLLVVQGPFVPGAPGCPIPVRAQ